VTGQAIYLIICAKRRIFLLKKKSGAVKEMIKINNKLIGTMRRAINDFNMIEEGDRVAVGLSGGKDSLALLAALSVFRKFTDKPFELFAITVDLGHKNADFSSLIEFCKEADVEYTIEKTNIAEIIFDIRKEKNPCSLCSKMRRGVLCSVLEKQGINKLALGHHADDVLETFFLSFLYESRLSTFLPVSFMDRTGITLLRPFVYAEEKDIAAAAAHLPVMFNPCPVNHYTRREYMKNLVKSLGSEISGGKERMLGAIFHPERNNLWK
jgi:tRNA(Ile)-lysidine synthase TilS/MesJ